MPERRHPFVFRLVRFEGLRGRKPRVSFFENCSSSRFREGKWPWPCPAAQKFPEVSTCNSKKGRRHSHCCILKLSTFNREGGAKFTNKDCTKLKNY